MSSDPFTRRHAANLHELNRIAPPPGRPHQVRAQWQERQRPRHLNADDGDPLAVKALRWLGRRPWIFVAIAIVALGYFLGRLIWSGVAWHWS